VSDLSKRFFKGAADPVEANEASKVRFETPRLIIREIRPDDVDRFHEISSTPGFHYYCFDGTREAAQAFVDNAIANQGIDKKTGRRESYVLAVELKSTGECIGHVAIEPVDFFKPEVQANVTFYENTTPEQRVLLNYATHEPNYFVDVKHQNGGLGSEALINIVHYAWEVLGFRSMSATQHPTNVKAIHNAQTKIGCVPIGDTQIDTTNGMEPRILSILTPATFYPCRENDKFQNIQGYDVPAGKPMPGTAPAPKA